MAPVKQSAMLQERKEVDFKGFLLRFENSMSDLLFLCRYFEKKIPLILSM